uniref:Uncharacterized protein n=1 Tax=Anguilla anguilla TaxID=7936 RepID=A0A0E9WF47_ANGAN
MTRSPVIRMYCMLYLLVRKYKGVVLCFISAIMKHICSDR